MYSGSQGGYPPEAGYPQQSWYPPPQSAHLQTPHPQFQPPYLGVAATTPQGTLPPRQQTMYDPQDGIASTWENPSSGAGEVATAAGGGTSQAPLEVENRESYEVGVGLLDLEKEEKELSEKNSSPPPGGGGR